MWYQRCYEGEVQGVRTISNWKFKRWVSWHDGWQSWQRAQRGQRAYDRKELGNYEELKHGQHGWRTLGEELSDRSWGWTSRKGGQMGTRDCSPPRWPCRNICSSNWGLRWTWGCWVSSVTFYVFQKKNCCWVQKGNSILGIKVRYWNKTKIIIPCISNLCLQF